MSRLYVLIVLLIAGCTRIDLGHVGPQSNESWRAVHFLGYETDTYLDSLSRHIPELAEMGINVLILEVDYHFEFNSQPELRQGKVQITKEGARRFARCCRKNDIRLFIQFQCLGHQSWAGETFPLLTNYPHFDLTPGAFPNNEGIYCREWDPTNPDLHSIVFQLLDELIDAFQTEGIHVGMDEVFLLGHEKSPSTFGKDPALLFANAVNELHTHLVKKRGVEMLMWGDRFIDGEKFDYGEWEASLNGTAAAVDMVPRDIIICDWHYEPRAEYPSIPMFIKKGFRVLPTSWRNVEASRNLIEYSLGLNHPQVLGHLFTRWSVYEDPVKYEPIVEGLKIIHGPDEY
ncbi:hypothetical protein BVY01_04510 [bacterium I07]|nr:hypothetical protein BVY01_04510 [bacterium I07]